MYRCRLCWIVLSCVIDVLYFFDIDGISECNCMSSVFSVVIFFRCVLLFMWWLFVSCVCMVVYVCSVLVSL